MLVAEDFPPTAPEFDELNDDEWAEYILYNIGKPCPAPGPGDEELARAHGWPSWRSFQALKRAANWY